MEFFDNRSSATGDSQESGKKLTPPSPDKKPTLNETKQVDSLSGPRALKESMSAEMMVCPRLQQFISQEMGDSSEFGNPYNRHTAPHGATDEKPRLNEILSLKNEDGESFSSDKSSLLGDEDVEIEQIATVQINENMLFSQLLNVSPFKEQMSHVELQIGTPGLPPDNANSTRFFTDNEHSPSSRDVTPKSKAKESRTKDPFMHSKTAPRRRSRQLKSSRRIRDDFLLPSHSPSNTRKSGWRRLQQKWDDTEKFFTDDAEYHDNQGESEDFPSGEDGIQEDGGTTATRRGSSKRLKCSGIEKDPNIDINLVTAPLQ